MLVVFLQAVVTAAAPMWFVPKDPSEPPTAQEASSICVYDDARRQWVCAADAIAHFRVEDKEEFTSIAGANVKVQALRLIKPDGSLCRGALNLAPAEAARETLRCIAEQEKVLGCPVAAELTVASATERVVVDWNQVAFTVNGRARQALPGFAKAITSSLVQRPSVAPPGSTLVESVFGEDTSCLIGRYPPWDAAGDELMLTVPVRVGERDEVIVWKRSRRWVPSDERTIFALVPQPAAVPPISTPPAELATDDGVSLSLALGVPGISVAVLGTAAFCGACFVPYYGRQQGLTTSQAASLTAGMCLGGAAADVVGLTVAGIGVGIDAAGASEVEAKKDRAKREREIYETSKANAERQTRLRDAYFSKRKELGLDAADDAAR